MLALWNHIKRLSPSSLSLLGGVKAEQRIWPRQNQSIDQSETSRILNWEWNLRIFVFPISLSDTSLLLSHTGQGNKSWGATM